MRNSHNHTRSKACKSTLKTRKQRVSILLISLFSLMLFQYLINFSTFNNNSLLNNMDGISDKLNSADPDLSGTGVTLPLKGYSNASKLGEQITSWQGSGPYQSSNIEFLTPNNFWTGATISYEKVRINIYDINREDYSVPVDFGDWSSFNAYGTTLPSVSRSHGTGNTPWISDETVKYDFFQNNQNSNSISLTHSSSTVNENERVIIYEVSNNDDPVDSCGQQQYSDSDYSGNDGNTGSSASGKINNDYERYYELFFWHTDCNENNINNNHADIWLDDTYTDDNQVGISGDLDYYLRAKDDGDCNGKIMHGNSQDKNNQSRTYYFEFDVSNEIYHAYDIDFSGTSYMGNTVTGGAGYSYSATITIDLEYYDGNSWEDATGANVIYQRSNSNWNSENSISDSNDYINDAIKTYGFNSGNSYRMSVKCEFLIDSNYVLMQDLSSFVDHDCFINTYVKNLALTYDLEASLVQNQMSEGVQTHTGDVIGYWSGTIDSDNTEQGSTSFKVTTLNDEYYNGFIANYNNKQELTQGASYSYKLDAWIPTGYSISFRMRQYPSGGFQTNTEQIVVGNNAWQSIEMNFEAEIVGGTYVVSNQIEGVQIGGSTSDVFSFWVKNLALQNTTHIGYESNDISFGYDIDGDVMFSFETYVSEGIEGATGYADVTDPIDTLENAEIVVEVLADGSLWQSASYSLKELRDDGDRSIEYSNSFSKGIMDGASNLKIRAYVDISTDFSVAYDLSNAYALIRNVEITCDTQHYISPSLDIDFQLTDSGSPIDNPVGINTPNQEISNNLIDFNIDDADGFILKTTTADLTLNYDVTYFLTFELNLPTDYSAEFDSYTIFNTTFDYDLSSLDLGSSYDSDYKESFYYEIGIPNSALWDLEIHDHATPGRIPLGYVDDVSEQADEPSSYYSTDQSSLQNTYLFIDSSKTFESYIGTNSLILSNNLITSEPFNDQRWRLNFTIPSVIDELITSNKSDSKIKDNPSSTFLRGEDIVNLYVNFTQTLDESGFVKILYLNDSDDIQFSPDQKTLASDELIFSGLGEGWNLDTNIPPGDDYKVIVNYTADADDYTGLGLTGGLFRACLSKKIFSIIQEGAIQMDETYTGNASTVGVYGYTNGTYENGHSYDEWADIGGGIYSSSEHSVLIPENDTEPWEVDDHIVNVLDLSDKKEYLPDANFSNIYANISFTSAGFDDGNYVDIIVDGINREIGGRGVNLVRLDSDGTFIYSNDYDTYGLQSEANALADYIEDTCEKGDIIILAIRDSAVTYLPGNATKAIKTLGSQKIDSYNNRDNWGMISIKGLGMLEEVFSKRNNGVSSGEWIFSENWNLTVSETICPTYRWGLEETSGTSIHNDGLDSMGEGEALGGVEMGHSGPRNNSFYFDGQDDMINFTTSEITAALDKNLTISFWIKPTDLGTNREQPMDKDYGGEFALTLENDVNTGMLHYYHGTGRSGGEYWSWTALPVGTVQNNEWQHICITRDVSTRQMKSYYNGVLHQSTTYSTAPEDQPTESWRNLKIGSGYSHGFQGYIDDVRIYTSAIDRELVKCLSQPLDPEVGKVSLISDEEYGNAAQIHFNRIFDDRSKSDIDSFPINGNSGQISPSRNQEDNGGGSGSDSHSAGMSYDGGNNRYQFTAHMDSYAYDYETGYNTIHAQSSFDDHFNPQFITETSLGICDSINDPTAKISLEIDYDSGYSCCYFNYDWDGDSHDLYGYSVSSDPIIKVYLIDPSSSSHLIISDSNSFDEYSNFDSADGSYDIDISSYFSQSGEYKLRLEVNFDFDNYYSGHAEEFKIWPSEANPWIWGDVDNRLRVSIADIDFEYQDVGQLMDDDIGIELTNPVDFQGRDVENYFDGKLQYSFEVDSNLQGINNGLANCYIGAWLTIDGTTYEQTSTNNLEYYRGGGVYDAFWDIPAMYLSGANDIILKLGVKIQNMSLDWSCFDIDSNVYIYDPRLILEGKPDLSDISLQVSPETSVVSGNVIDFIPTSKGSGYANLTNWDINMSAGAVGAKFRSTSENLNFTFYHDIELSFNEWIPTSYYCESEEDSEFHLNFTLNTPYSSFTHFSERYQDNFYFDIIFPRFVINGEPYWDLISATVDGKGKLMMGEENMEDVYTDDEIFVAENESHSYGEAPFNVMQYATFYNDLYDEWISGSSQELSWNVLFKAPNYLQEIVISNMSDFSKENFIYTTNKEELYIRGILLNTAKEGHSNIKAGFPNGTLFYKKTFLDVSQLQYYDNTDGIHLLPTYPESENYVASTSYHASNIANYSSGERCIGIYNVGFKQVNFSVETKESVVNGPIINKPIYDTKTDSGLIEIKVQFNDSNTHEPLLDADVSITVGEYVKNSYEYGKECVVYEENGWTQNTPMVYLDDGYYAIYIDPSRDSDGDLIGNMTWGYHNFTIELSKAGYDTKVVTGDFNIIVDTYMKIISPYHYSMDEGGNPHYLSTAVMGEEFSIAVALWQNQTDSGGTDWIPIVGADGNYFPNQEFYINQIEANYSLAQIWENWNTSPNLVTRDEWDEIINWTCVNDPTYSKNPINGSLYTIGYSNIFSNNIQWPTIQHMNKLRYENDLYFIYNVSVNFKRSMNWTALGDDDFGWKFQPNMVKNLTTAPPDINGETPITDASRPNLEEPVRVSLFDPTEANASDLILLNYAKDGSAFSFDDAVYNNGSDSDPDAHADFYKIRQYLFNNTPNTDSEFMLETGPAKNTNDGTYNSFRLRVLFNCTHRGMEEQRNYYAPPVGYLNESNQFYGKTHAYAGSTYITLFGWNETDIPLIADDSTLFTWTANTTGPAPWDTSQYSNTNPAWIRNDVKAQTYVTPWLFFNESLVGNHSLKIIAEKKGFISADLDLSLEILAQRTWVKNTPTNKSYEQVSFEPDPGTVAEFDINYVDITNNKTLGEILLSGASIQVIEDDFLELYKNGLGDRWSYMDHENGTYTIYINQTTMEPQSNGEITFMISKNLHQTQTFTIDLDPDDDAPLVSNPTINATVVELGQLVFITCLVSDSNGILSVYAKIQQGDDNTVDLVQLFDDGNHGDGDEGDGNYSNYWDSSGFTLATDYEIDINATDDTSLNNWGLTDDIDTFNLRDTTAPLIQNVQISDDPLEFGTFLQINATITDESSIAVVYATIKKSGAYQAHVQLFDDGTHGDGAMNDGIYGNTWDSTGYDLGSYTIDINATDASTNPEANIGTDDNAASFDLLDTTGPTIQNVMVSADPLELGTVLQINATVSDLSGIANVYAMLNLSGVFILSLEMFDDGSHGDGSSGDGIYGISWDSTGYDLGSYTVDINATDLSDNPSANIAALYGIQSFNLQDTTAPTIQDVMISETTLELGASIQINATVSDLSGIANVYAMLNLSGVFILSLEMFDDGSHGDGDSGDGIYGINWDSTGYDLGSYTVDINATDLSDNPSANIAAQYDIKSFNLQDTTAPTIQDVMISETILELGELLQINATVSDLSGIANVYAMLNLSSVFIVALELFDDGSHGDGNAGDGIYGYSWNSTGYDLGSYTVDINATDLSVNPSSNIATEYGIKSFTLQDTTAPTIQNFQLSADPLELGSILIFNVSVSDHSGIASVYVTINISGVFVISIELYNDGNHYDGIADDNIYGNSWNSTGYDLGLYSIDINATDLSTIPYSNIVASYGIETFDLQDNTAPNIHGVSVSDDPLELGDLLQINATISDLSGIDEVWVTFNISGLYQDSLQLFDDGTHGDGEADDGVYGNAWNSTGFSLVVYTIDINATDLSDNPIANIGYNKNAEAFDLQDTTDPTIENIQTSITPIELGESLQVNATVSDLSGLISVYATFRRSGIYHSNITLFDDGNHGDGDAGDGIYSNYWDTTGFALGGYTLSINATDGSTNPSENTAFDSIPSFNVLDTTDPSISNVRISEDPLELGSILQVNATVSDLSGIISVYAMFLFSDDYQANITLFDDGSHGDGDAGDGIYSNIWDSTGFSLGNYVIEINATDGSTIPSNNIKTLPNAETFTLQDTTNPSIDSTEIFPDIFLELGNGLQINITISDLSSITLVYATFNISGIYQGKIQLFDDGNHGDGDEGDNIFGNLWDSTGYTLGSYTLDFNATDGSNNIGILKATETFTLQDTTEPSISNVIITPEDGIIGTTFTIKATVTDLSAILTVYASIRNDSGTWRAGVQLLDDGNGADQVAGDDIFTGQWVSTGFGADTYSIYINATDIASVDKQFDPSKTITLSLDDYNEPSITEPETDPSLANPGDPITISATITDDTGIHNYPNITIFRPDSSILGTFDLTHVGSDRWEYVLNTDGFSSGRYNITFRARDTSSHENLKISINLTYFIITGDDLKNPNVTAIVDIPNSEVGSIITVHCNVSDDKILDSVIAYIQKPDGIIIATVILTDLDADGNFTGQWDTTGFEIGTYYLDIFANDTFDNQNYTNNADTFDLSDSFAPTISDPYINAPILQYGAQLLITVEVTDPSGVACVYADIQLGNDNTIMTVELFDDGSHGDGAANDNIFGNWWNSVGDDLSPNYEIDIRVIDDSLNANDDELDDACTFDLRDTTAPSLSDEEISPDDGLPGELFDINVRVYDLSGIDTVYATIRFSDNSIVKILQLFDDGLHNDSAYGDGIYGNTWNSGGYANGLYSISINATDNSNHTDANTAESLNIDNGVNLGELTPPSITNILVSPTTDDIQYGTIINITCQVTDASGVQEVKAFIEKPDETIIATIILYDDGMHNDNLAGDNIYGNTWNTSGKVLGNYYVDFQATDNSLNHNVENVNNGENFNLIDTLGPRSIVISINGGSTYTSSQGVIISLQAIDAYKMRFRNVGDEDWSDWEDFASTKSWELKSGMGERSISVMLKDIHGNEVGPINRSIIRIGGNANGISGGSVNTLNLTEAFGILMEIELFTNGFIEAIQQEKIFAGIQNPPTTFTAIYFYSFEVYDENYQKNSSLIKKAVIRLYFDNTNVTDFEHLTLMKYLDNGTWIEIGITVNSNEGYAEFTTTGFSIYTLGIKEEGIVLDDDDDGEGNFFEDNFIIIIIIIIGSVAGVSVGGAMTVVKKKGSKQKAKPKDKLAEKELTLDSKVEEPEGSDSKMKEAARRKRERLMKVDEPMTKSEKEELTSQKLRIRTDKRPTPSKKKVVKKIPSATAAEVAKGAKVEHKKKATDQHKKKKQQLAASDSKDTKELTEEQKKELEKTEKEVAVKKTKFTCIVHRGPIVGNVYICPNCQSFYCQKCAKALKIKGEKCWSCESEIMVDVPAQRAPIKSEASSKKELDLKTLDKDKKKRLEDIETELKAVNTQMKSLDGEYEAEQLNQEEYMRQKEEITKEIGTLMEEKEKIIKEHEQDMDNKAKKTVESSQIKKKEETKDKGELTEEEKELIELNEQIETYKKMIANLDKLVKGNVISEEEYLEKKNSLAEDIGKFMGLRDKLKDKLNK